MSGTPSIGAGADHGAPGPGPRSEKRLSATVLHAATARPKRFEPIVSGPSAVPLLSMAAGGSGATQAPVVSFRYAVSTLPSCRHAAVTRPMPSTAARSSSARSRRPGVVPETGKVDDVLQLPPGTRVRAASGELIPPFCQNTVAAPLFGATTRSVTLSATPPEIGVGVPHGPLLGRSIAYMNRNEPVSTANETVTSPATSPEMFGRTAPAGEIVSTSDHGSPSGRRAVLITQLPGGPTNQTTVAVPSDARKMSGLPPAPPGIGCPAVQPCPGALSAHMTAAGLPSDQTAVIRPCGSTPTAGLVASPVPEIVSAGVHGSSGLRTEARIWFLGVRSPLNSFQTSAATPGEFVAIRASRLEVPGSDSGCGASHDSAPSAPAGSAAQTRNGTSAPIRRLMARR